MEDLLLMGKTQYGGEDKTMSSKNKNTGFTLIELLVVVAIISILAAIALVNYQNAVVRGKVAHAKSEMRIISEALELYRVDYDIYPPAAIRDFQLPEPLNYLTTPLSYITSVPKDPFGLAKFDFNPYIEMAGYNYKEKRTTSDGMPGETYGHIWRHYMNKNYFIHSCGPNKIWEVMPYIDYDPTNGTVSKGDICIFGSI